jgi:uncharacterized 2Fe-2S/4Fe-4S cluster protein (DUF4445 family)
MEHRPQVSETFEIAVPVAHQPLFPPEPGKADTGFAADIGTTTVVVMLVDLVTGAVLSRAGAFNEQIRFGDNVLTRIEATLQPGRLAALQRAVVMETLAPLLQTGLEQAGRSADRIAGGAVAGNTAMLHLLLGEDPAPLGRAPFTPRFLEARQVSAADMGLHLPGLTAACPIQLLPGIAAFLGADITGGIFASGLAYDPKPGLLVDLGTNGEIVLQQDGRLTGCATAAGPAFEGCGLSSGTRAQAGAVRALQLQLRPFQLRTQMIEMGTAALPSGICGSAYVDFLATGRQSGLLSATGRFEPAAWAQLPAAFRSNTAGARAVRIGGGAGTLQITERDVALLLQAKAALGAGIEVLLGRAGIKASDLGRVYLAGGFGMQLDVAHAIAIGILPGMRPPQVRVVGNTALAGALLALVDRTTLGEMTSLSRRVAVVELNRTADFSDRYVDHLLLP